MVVEPAKEIESALKSECIMSIISAGSCSSSELPQALAAAVSFQDRKCWGVCAVRRPPRLARYSFVELTFLLPALSTHFDAVGCITLSTTL